MIYCIQFSILTIQHRFTIHLFLKKKWGRGSDPLSHLFYLLTADFGSGYERRTRRGYRLLPQSEEALPDWPKVSFQCPTGTNNTCILPFDWAQQMARGKGTSHELLARFSGWSRRWRQYKVKYTLVFSSFTFFYRGRNRCLLFRNTVSWISDMSNVPYTTMHSFKGVHWVNWFTNLVFFLHLLSLRTS